MAQEGAVLLAEDADRQMRRSLWPYLGRTWKIAGWVFIAMAVLVVALGRSPSGTSAEVIAAALVLFVLGTVLSQWRFKVGAGTVAEVRGWLGSHPFPLTGYFEVLGQKPAHVTVVQARVRFVAEPPPLELVKGLMGRLDSAGAVELTPGGGLVLRSVQIRAAEQVQALMDNHLLVPYMNDVLDHVIVQLHRTYPIAGVEFVRE